MWQTCPICSGVGTQLPKYTNYTAEKCDVCNGKKIISELTGLPPKS